MPNVNHGTRAFPRKAHNCNPFNLLAGGGKGAKRPRSAARSLGRMSARQEDPRLLPTRRAEGMVPEGVHPCRHRPFSDSGRLL